MTAAEIQLHLRYSAWASRKLVEAVRAVPDADSGNLSASRTAACWARLRTFTGPTGCGSRASWNRWRNPVTPARRWRRRGQHYRTNG